MFSSLSLAETRETRKGKADLNCAEAAADPHRTTLSVTGFDPGDYLLEGLRVHRQGWVSLLFASVWVSSQAKAWLKPCLLSGPVPECFPKDVN